MRVVSVFFVIIFLLSFSNQAIAGLFGKNTSSSSGSGGEQTLTEEIPIRDAAFKMMEKRKIEARKLVSEGLELMREGEKKKNETLITKGRIKKEIGQKQLQVLKEQSEERKKEEQSYGW